MDSGGARKSEPVLFYRSFLLAMRIFCGVPMPQQIAQLIIERIPKAMGKKSKKITRSRTAAFLDEHFQQPAEDGSSDEVLGSTTEASEGNALEGNEGYRHFIDRLSESNVDEYVDLPMIAVMGDTSSGTYNHTTHYTNSQSRSLVVNMHRLCNILKTNYREVKSAVDVVPDRTSK